LPTLVHDSAKIAAGVVIGNGVIIEENVVIDSGVILGNNCTLKAGVHLKENVFLPDDTILAEGTVLDSSSVWATFSSQQGLLTIVRSMQSDEFNLYMRADKAAQKSMYFEKLLINLYTTFLQRRS
jgi:UDP-3-O-[3-hydroxymyristoyl] glucosamine N-acyltransferase